MLGKARRKEVLDYPRAVGGQGRNLLYPSERAWSRQKNRSPVSATCSSAGSSLAELALVLPIVLLLVLVTVDFGRAFFGWVTLNNMARVGANYAALHRDLVDDSREPG